MTTVFLRFILENASSFQECWFFFLMLLGATITQVLSFNIGTIGATPFLQMWFKQKTDNWYVRSNCILLILVGTVLSFIILEPNSAKTSMFAGLTWCGTLQSLGQTIKTSNHD